MQLRLLDKKDDKALLMFELKNKAWFESYIEAREPTFYSPRGIQQHIADFLTQYHKGQRLPLLILNDDNDIIGRINLHKICRQTDSAYLGYRVGKNNINRGVASYAVKQILTLAPQNGVKYIIALASTANKPSQIVLIKNGFYKKRLIFNKAFVNGQQIDCIEYQKEISL
ncbi:GNAT family N-acetyltransferase [Zooshikella marina]|uniref:GNAT family N-acetyltransferase n=1 Tax=Zooshikella ganghwensis TaxID=202772 RepID=UPI001BAFF68D|nr:GNAT family N-acetyltransferase [Zooshikella ganghwensis]MBU2707035.1 GNAT family N-acetyltransferase [Zooshikella ganghwensis]